jgi:transposase
MYIRHHMPDIQGEDREVILNYLAIHHRPRDHAREGGWRAPRPWSKGNPPRLSADQQAELAHLVETGPDRVTHGVVRWRRVDLQRVIAERFGVVYHERTVGKILKQLGFSHISARRRHPAQDGQTIAALKKTLQRR